MQLFFSLLKMYRTSSGCEVRRPGRFRESLGTVKVQVSREAIGSDTPGDGTEEGGL